MLGHPVCTSRHTRRGNCIPAFTAATAVRFRTMMALPRRLERTGRLCGLCGFLYKDAGRHGPVGRAMFDMLTPLDRRGTDSTGVALYGEPRDDSYVLRVRMERNGDTPDRVHDALAAAGTVSEASRTGGNLRARIGYDGDLGELTDRVEQVPDAEVFSIGRSMEIVKDVGDARRRRARPRRTPASRAATPSATRAWPRSRWSTSPTPPVLGAPVRRHLGRPQRPHHELPQAAPPAGRAGPPLRHRQRLRGDRRLHRRQARAGRVARGRAALRRCTTWTAPSPT